MNRTLFQNGLWAAVWAVALALGFAVGKATRAPVEENAPADSIAAPASVHLSRPIEEAGLETESMRLLARLCDLAGRDGDLGLLLADIRDVGQDRAAAILLEAIARLGPAGLERLYRALEAEDNLFDDPAVVVALFDRMVRLDEDRFFKLAEDKGDDAWNFLPMLGMIFLASADETAAIRRLEKQSADEPDKDLTNAVAMGIAIRSTADSIAWLRENGGESAEYDQVFEILLREPAKTLDEAKKIEDPEKRAGALGSLFQKWAKLDGASAFEAVRGMTGEPERDEWMRSALVEWALVDPEQAAARAAEVGCEASALGSWLMVDANAAIAWAQQHLEGARMAGVLGECSGNLSPGQTAELFVGLPVTSRCQALQDPEVLAKLVLTDPGLVFQTAAQLPDVGRAGETGEALGEQMARTDLNGAMAAAAELPAGAVRDGYLGALARAGARAGEPEAMLAWLDGMRLPAGSAAVSGLLTEWASADPESAVQAARGRDASLLPKIVGEWLQHDDAGYVFEHMRSEMAAVPAVQEAMADVWIDRDPEAGARLLLANSPNGEMDAALGVLLGKWRAQDPDAARAFLESAQ